MPLQDGLGRGNAARFVTVRPCVTVHESRRKRFECGHLLVCSRRPVLQQLPLTVLRPSVCRRLREAGRALPLSIVPAFGRRIVMSTSQPPPRYGRTLMLIAAYSFGDGARFWSSQCSKASARRSNAATNPRYARQLTACNHSVDGAGCGAKKSGGFIDGQKERQCAFARLFRRRCAPQAGSGSKRRSVWSTRCTSASGD